jgi:hypothetical protein
MKKTNALLTLSGLALAGLVFTAQSTPDISGQWNSNIGVVYEIQQSGSQYTWSVASLNQSGTGTVSGNNVTLSGPGWTVKGTITETDASGKPTKIVGENGVVLFRTTAGAPTVSVKPPVQKPVPSAPKAPAGGAVSVSGNWNSSIGATYEIQQSGNNFTWSAPTLNQSGTGTISGNNITLIGPGWTVKGAITATDPSGNATKIVGENNVVLFRVTDGQPGQILPPAQQPGPQGQYGPGVTGDLTQFKDIPPLSPQLLAQVAAPATRRATIEALSASPTTKATLDKVAASAGKTVNSLKEQTLSGNPAVDSPVSPGSPPAQAFLDLWKAPVHISPTVPGPSYLDGGSTRVVGMAIGVGVYVHPSLNSLQMMAQKDYFLVSYEGGIVVPIDLPPGGGQYMVTIHAIDQNGTALDKNTELPIVDAYVEFPHNYMDKIPLVTNSAKTALVGLFSEFPNNAGDSYSPIDSMPHVSVNLRIGSTTYWPVYITGVTITRL